ncbi:MAG: T9SS type A sorting domain-containing protein [Candidatus Cloacimonetes bacterium]|nr:T9SS type A sorting domain-containing protein [Candidatus Cloacimonadota bacterium]
MKTLFLLVLVLLVSAGLSAAIKSEAAPMLNDVGPASTNPVITDEMGDLIYELDVESITSDSQLLGVEYDGTYVWVTGGGNGLDPNYLYKIDPVAGTLVSSYEQPVAACVWGIRDLAYVDTEGKIYGGNETDFFSFDIASETWTVEFGSSFGTIRALAYDGSHFWTKDFSNPIYEFDAGGTVINSYADENSAYGMAYDSFADCLWLFAEQNTFFQYDLNGAATGTSYTVIHGSDGDIGGAFYYEGGLVPGTTILGCLVQGMPDVLYGMELRDAADPDSPAVPTDVIATPEASGIFQAEIAWTCPATTIGGTVLTDLDEMRVYRDGTLIFTDTSPAIGAPGFHMDSSMLTSGFYNYGVSGFNDAGEGITVENTIWVGEDAPAAVDNLVLAQTSPGVLSGTLTWDNPTTGLHGGACNNAISGYHIERNDGVLFEVTGSATSFIDDTIPLAGTYCYAVVPYNIIGDGGSAVSNLVLIGESGVLISEDFSDGVPPAGWYVDGMSLTNWGAATGNHAGGSGIEMYFSWTPPFNGISRMCTMAMDTSNLAALALEFKHSVDDYAGGYTLGAATSSDGINWNDAWTVMPTGAMGAETINVDVTTADVGSTTFQMCFYLNGDSYAINYWYIDDVMLTSTGTATFDPPANLAVDEDSGLFTWDAPAGNRELESYNVYLDDTVAGNTADTEWLLENLVYNQTYTAGVMAVYDDGESDIVTIEFTYMGTNADDNIIAKTELTGNYPNPFNPDTNIAFSVQEAGKVTLEVYNLRGELVKTLINGVRESGDQIVSWNGSDDAGKTVASGVYFYTMKTGNFISTKKMILMK